MKLQRRPSEGLFTWVGCPTCHLGQAEPHCSESPFFRVSGSGGHRRGARAVWKASDSNSHVAHTQCCSSAYWLFGMKQLQGRKQLFSPLDPLCFADSWAKGVGLAPFKKSPASAGHIYCQGQRQLSVRPWGLQLMPVASSTPIPAALLPDSLSSSIIHGDNTTLTGIP